jgi:hypothetical protein
MGATLVLQQRNVNHERGPTRAQDSSHGIMPTHMPVCLPRSNRVGVPMINPWASAVSGPAPGWVIRCRASGRFLLPARQLWLTPQSSDSSLLAWQLICKIACQLTHIGGVAEAL